ncbi:DUF2478 domain-containing protein [Ruegeria profundi]|uniref:3-dehydroquinate dehydratase n=1 Tax=Ruegeria profundi TaxID=1685378 RepID=A0A0X3U326_9RHOB|nr:DUF2478 domain-containing protein [Ruegeria profundi]KUJ81236.1 3-dehydroquinate dehydratase [Ruegeria profundi]
MRIAYTMAPGRGDTDLVLHQVAQSVIQAGYCPAGTAQINTERADAGPCDMDVLVLPDGPKVRISQSLGREARGCRLDPEALESAVGIALARLPVSDCLIVNKFGKHEAEGRGFRSVIADALALDLPVLVGLNQLNADAFLEFSGGIAQQLQPDAAEIEDWLFASIGARREVA